MSKELAVFNNIAMQRFECARRGEMAFLEYAVEGTHLNLNHTYVPDALRGLGVGGILVNAASAEAKQQGWSLVPHCTFVVAYLRKHPELA